MRKRLDAELVRRGLAGTQAKAQEAVLSGLVTVGGRPALKPGMLVGIDEPLHVEPPAQRFVSRGGDKLSAALDRFAVDPTGRKCLDAGASTGGFTDCLLQRGAASVTAVDVGYGQLSWRLRTDPRVSVLERTNVRDLLPQDVPAQPSLVVADLSFVSLGLTVHALAAVSAPESEFIVLVKPQFEARAADVGKGGVVRDPEVWARVIQQVADSLESAGCPPCEVMTSPLLGPAGNVEFLLWARRGARGNGDGAGRINVEAAVQEGSALRESRTVAGRDGVKT